MEGYNAGDTRAKRNNNPGNLKFAGQPGAEADEDGFAVFMTARDGFNALKAQIRAAIEGKSSVYTPDMVLYNPNYVSKKKTPKEKPGFFQVYAPSEDKNNPKHYAEFVAENLGVSTSTKLIDIFK